MTQKRARMSLSQAPLENGSGESRPLDRPEQKYPIIYIFYQHRFSDMVSLENDRVVATKFSLPVFAGIGTCNLAETYYALNVNENGLITQSH